MSSYKIFLFICVIYTIYSSSSALLQEGLISNHEAYENAFGYQVAIIGKRNFTSEQNLICGAGIIGKNKVLSAAQCFIDKHGNHKPFTFSVIANEINLNISMDKDILIHLIYLVTQESYISNDIAVASLVQPFDFLTNSDLTILKLPGIFDNFWTESGWVAGHGYYWIRYNYSSRRGDPTRIGGSDGLLRFMRVAVPFTTNCRFGHGLTSDYSVICGVPLDVPDQQFFGLCDLDTGSPFVINRVVVGVASSNHENCDDSIDGGLYTKVAAYEDFIKAIVKDEPFINTIIYPNRPHVLYI